METRIAGFLLKAFFTISIFILCSSLKVNGQGIYEVKYTFPNYDNKEYTALIFYYSKDDNNNMMRIRYFYNSKWEIVDEKFDVVQFHLQKYNKDYWVIKGKNASVMNDAAEQYVPDNIFLSKSPAATYFEPAFTSSRSFSKPDSVVYGKITSFKKFNSTDITNLYLADFNLKWPDSQDVFYPAKIDLILVSNSNDAQLGSGFEANHRKLKSLFRDIATVCGVGINIIEINGDNFNKNYLLGRLNEFTPANNDIVIFYYSGHGFHKTGDPGDWPFLDMRQSIASGLDDNSLSLDNDIYKPLCSKGARLTLVFGECCNMYSGALVPIKDNPLLMAPSNMLNAASIKKLFNKTGKLLLATSRTNEPSYYSVSFGGDFCNSFISSLIEETGISNEQDRIKWSHLLSSAALSTQKDCAAEAQKQNPVQHYEIQE